MIKAVIIGASGYTGYELVRILSGHKEVEIVGVSSRTYQGKTLKEVFPSLRSEVCSLIFKSPAKAAAMEADVLFSALPHGASMETVKEAAKKGTRVIDLSADFRLHDLKTYEKWYVEHTAEELLKDAVYGLPELHREEIKKAKLVANPGCYPTAAILSLAPLLKSGLAEDEIIVDSKSGLSGAGRAATLETSFVEASGSVRAYKIGSHRHTPEIEQELSAISKSAISVTFTPHLVPILRGILSTSYAKVAPGIDTPTLIKLYRDFYLDEPFIRVLDKGDYPDTKRVRASNFCDIGIEANAQTGRVVLVSAIDNLTKGASGQAVQNMNLLFGFDETQGLGAEPLGL